MSGNATALKRAAVGDQYILSGLSDHDRLRMLSEMHDSETRRLLRRAGFSLLVASWSSDAVWVM